MPYYTQTEQMYLVINPGFQFMGISQQCVPLDGIFQFSPSLFSFVHQILITKAWKSFVSMLGLCVCVCVWGGGGGGGGGV